MERVIGLVITLLISTIAVMLFVLIYPLNAILVLFKYRLKGLEMFYYTALNLDIFANQEYRTFWNTTMIDEKGYKFGKVGETISSVLGKNKILNNLTLFGLFWYYFLYIVDIRYWKTGGHCYNSIQNLQILKIS